MKYVLIVLVVLLVWWLLLRARPSRSTRDGRNDGPRASPGAPPQAPPEDMVACTHCGVHLPRGDALPGRGGVFCSEAHRAAHEAAQPR